MLEEEHKQELLKKNYLLSKRHNARVLNHFVMLKNRLFLLGSFIAVLIVIFSYLISSYANIYDIEVNGNYYLHTADVIKLSGLKKGDKFYLTSTSHLAKVLTSDPYIAGATVKRSENNKFIITIKETKLLAYYYNNNDIYIWTQNDDKIKLAENREYIITKIPLIEGYTFEQLKDLLSGFKDIDKTVLNKISEIHRYPFSYDENMMEVIMSDGNYIFVSSNGLKLLKNYDTIISSLKNSNNSCLYLDEITNTGYSSVCPWEKQEEVKESAEKENNGSTDYQQD